MRNNSTWALSALSPIAWAREAWNLPLTLLATLGAVAVAFIAQVAYLIAAVATGSIDMHHPALSPDQSLIAQIVIYVPLGAYLLLVIPALARTSLRELGFHAPSGRDLGVAVTGAVVMTISVNVAGSALGALTHRHDTETAVALMEQMKTPVERIAFFTVACVLAPMLEELAFRIFVFNAMTRYVPVAIAALASGVLFGLVHSTSLAQIVTVSIPLAIGGIVLAYVYATTRCYWANVTTHALFNGVAVVALFVFHAK